MVRDAPAWHRLAMTEMGCSHEGFHAIGTSYDRHNGVLVYFWACEHCGVRLGEARRERYRPSYDPHGNQRYVTAQAA